MLCSSQNELFQLIKASYTLGGGQNGLSVPLQTSDAVGRGQNGLCELL